jgi:hypothetical protein
LEDAKKQPIYDDRNRFSIRFLDTEYPATAEWFPQFSHKTEDVAVVQVRVDQEGFPGFNILPLGGEDNAGLEACLRGFGWPDFYPLGYFCLAEVSVAEKRLTVRIKEEISGQPPDSKPHRTSAQELIKLMKGTFIHGMSGAPVVRMETGSVFGVHRAWIKANDTGLCIPVKTFLKVWNEYSPFWPDLAFSLV